MKKAGIISQARMTSTRLPGKVMTRIGGVPMLKYHTDRLKESGLPVFIATTVNATDDVIAEFGKAESIPVYRGSESNVLSRYYEVAVQFNLDVIVRVTSDCPLIDGTLVKDAVNKYLKMDNESLYLSNSIERTFPRGFDVEVFSFHLLQEAYKNSGTDFEKEHVTPHVKAHSHHQHILYKEDASDLRITVDTPEDFRLAQVLIEQYNAHKLSHEQIIQLLRSHPELVAINAHIEQKKT